MLSSLRHPNYRLLWIGTLISRTGDWLDQVALNWLVLEQTGSVLQLGMVNLFRGLPILICTLIGGAVADRMERRRLMMMTQASSMALATLLAVIVLSGNAPLWAIFAIATARGVVVSFNLPARQSLISDLVPREDLANALVLNNLTMNLTKVLGPMLAGFIIAAFGTGICFVVNAVSFIAVLATLAAMRFPPRQVRERTESLAGSILSGLKFVRTNEVILLLVLVAVVPTFFGQPYLQLLAIFAYDVFKTGPAGLGTLTAAAAAGSVIGGVVMAQFSYRQRSGAAMLCMLGGFGVALGAFAANGRVAAAPVFLLFVGGLQMSYSVTHSSLLQLTVPDAYRGRVLSVLFLNRGLVSLGTASSAAAASVVGPRAAYLIMAAVVVTFAAALFIRSPALRRLRA
jgi:MFS family permease